MRKQEQTRFSRSAFVSRGDGKEKQLSPFAEFFSRVAPQFSCANALRSFNWKISTGSLRMPPWRKVRVRGSNKGNRAEACVTDSFPVSALRAMRNVPCAQPRTRYGSPGRSHKKR